jgi:hypothetical protein
LPEPTLDAWLAGIGAGVAPLDRRVVEAATDLVETISSRPEGMDGALFRFGNTLGADGWPIAEVCSWLALLGPHLDRPRRRRMGHYHAHAAVAQGWADGYVRGAHTGMCVDPTTGLVTLMVLRLRLQELFQYGQSADRPVSASHALVLVDVDLGGLPQLDADLLMACVAASVRDLFQEGETVARTGDRILVLAPRTDALEQRTEILADRLRLDSATRRAHATVVIDQLPRAELLERYLRDVVG